MPRPTAKTVFPIDPAKCKAVRHIPGFLYPLYDLMIGYAKARRVALHGRDSTAPLMFTTSVYPTVCNALAQSKNQTYRQRDQLADLGWIVLHKEGTYDTKAKHYAPDEWLVLEHPDFMKTKHYTGCPANQYPTHKDQEGVEVQVDGFDRAFRILGLSKLFAPIADVLETLSPEERDELVASIVPEHPEPFAPGITREEVLEHVRKLHQVPTDREQPKSLSIGQRQFPTEGTTNSLRMDGPIPYGGNDQVPTDRETSVKATVKETVTHTHTPATSAIAEPGQGDDPEECVCVLLENFTAANDGEPPRNFHERKDAINLARKHRGNKFRAAAAAWIQARPWNNSTDHPFRSFVNGFEAWAKKGAKPVAANYTPEQIKEFGDRSLALRNELDDRRKKDNDPGAEEF
jgi:hypothetical protein